MRIIRHATEDEMVLAFLAAEVDSPDYGPCLEGALGDRRLVDNADLSDGVANGRRKAALGVCRGYERNSFLFTGFPSEMVWKLVEVGVEELGDFYYVSNVRGWRVLSQGTRLVRDGAANVETVPTEERVNEKILAIERAIRGGLTYPPLIAVSEGEDERHVLVEGHTRATAYVRALAPEDTLELLVGYTADLSGWAFS